jgi:hypothetical protein
MNPTMKQLLSVGMLGGAFYFGAGDPSARAASPMSGPVVAKLAPLAAVQLTPSDGAAGDYFGNAVSLSGDGNTALIGARMKGFATRPMQGSAYLFVRRGDGWVQVDELAASDAAAGDEFGFAVALSSDGNTALVGAPYKGSGTQLAVGAAYIFARSGSNWTQEAELRAGDAAGHDLFGFAVALSEDGNTALIGADEKTFGTLTNQGAAYMFVRNGNGWHQQSRLTAGDASAGDYFGHAVSLSSDGNTALVGAPFKLIGSHTGTQFHQGSVYFFERNGSSWRQAAEQSDSEGASNDALGFSVSLSGDGNTALVGAVGKNIGLLDRTGSGYVFVRSGSSWTRQTELIASTGGTQDNFGYSVSLSGDGNTALVGTAALFDFVYVRAAGVWSQQDALSAGSFVALSGDANTALAGAPYAGTGVAYVLGSTYSIMLSVSPPNAGTVGGGGTFAADSSQLVTAQANPGYAFTNWTENGVAISTAPNYSFILDSNRTLVANFVAVATTNVTCARGTYRGLFAGGDVAQSSSGSFTLTTTAQGMLSASFMVGGSRYSSRGAFDSFGCCTQILRNAKGHGYTVHLQLSAADPDQLYGTVNAVDGSWSAALAGDRAIYHPVTNTAPQAGKYTLVIPGSYGVTSLPGGDGFGTVKVDAGGKVTLKGSLADGTSISHSSALSKTGEWPLYVRLNSGKGSFQGWVVLAPTPTNDLSGTLAWIKPVLPKAKFYPAGFSLQTTAPGFRYVPPAKGTPVLNLNQAVLVLSGGGLAQDLTNSVTLSANNRVTGPNKTSLTFTPSTGAFKGNVFDANGRRISCRGVALQSTNSAQGYFLGAGGQSGQVLLSAP